MASGKYKKQTKNRKPLRIEEKNEQMAFFGNFIA